MFEASIDDVIRARTDRSVQLVDVREPQEYAAGHVPGAVSIPMSQLTGRLGEIDRARRVLVICQSGGRSSAMTDVLRHHGYDAASVAGGTAAWASSGHPVSPTECEGN